MNDLVVRRGDGNVGLSGEPCGVAGAVCVLGVIGGEVGNLGFTGDGVPFTGNFGLVGEGVGKRRDVGVLSGLPLGECDEDGWRSRGRYEAFRGFLEVSSAVRSPIKLLSPDGRRLVKLCSPSIPGEMGWESAASASIMTACPARLQSRATEGESDALIAAKTSDVRFDGESCKDASVSGSISKVVLPSPLVTELAGCLDRTPELSASMIVDSSSERGRPGDGVRSIGAAVQKSIDVGRNMLDRLTGIGRLRFPFEKCCNLQP